MPVPDPPLNAAQCLQQAQQREVPAVPPADDSARVSEPRVVPSGSGPYPAGEAREPSSAASNPQYGPVRRVPRKTPANEIPLVLQPEDFADMMQEIVPQLIQEMPSQSEESSAAGHHSPREPAQKRPASREPSEEPGSAQRRPPPPGEAAETLLIDIDEYAPLRNSYVEVLIAGFLQKRMQKELPATNNMPEVQQQVDEAKVLEWDTVVGKQAVKVWRGAKARDIRKKMAHRFVGTRFVVTRKSDEEGTRIKARLCLQGHSDPDFHQKITSGLCHSPTLSQLGRSVLLQLMVSHHWTLNLGDVKGAFMEAGPLSDKFRPLYAHQPQGGIPGLHPDDVLEITGNLYGANDAPFQWYQTFDAEARKVGFQRSSFDSRLYFFRDSSNSLSGALGAHVDDTMTGGRGAEYDEAIAHLKSRFPYRKWRVGSGEFCGVVYAQNPHSFEISFQQSEYAKHIRPINMSKQRKTQKDSPATDKEVAALRAVNGAAGWLSGQSRPDLAAQTSFAQQAFPSPTVGSLLMANQLVHRAQQYADVSITVRDIPPEKLAVAFHSDAGFANAGAHKTQAGYLVAFVNADMDTDQESPYSPFAWKSYRLPRVVASTLAGETQAFATASGVAEWVSLTLVEARDGCFDLRTPRDPTSYIPIIGITDCKSLYDTVHAVSPPSKLDDKRAAIDVAIVRQGMERTGMRVRWCPTQLMLADSLTKDQSDPADLLRAVLMGGQYQLSPEATVLEQKKQQREARARRQAHYKP